MYQTLGPGDGRGAKTVKRPPAPPPAPVRPAPSPPGTRPGRPRHRTAGHAPGHQPGKLAGYGCSRGVHSLHSLRHRPRSEGAPGPLHFTPSNAGPAGPPGGLDPDAGLVAACRPGDPGALERLVERFQTAVVGTALRLVGDRGERGGRVGPGFGLRRSTVPTPSARVGRGYAAAVERILAGQPGAEALLRRVSAGDPGFAPAHAGLALLYHRAGRSGAARRRLERAAGAASGASRRERSHVEVLGALIEGPPGGAALARLRAHLALFPRDALLVQEGAELLTWKGAADPRPARLAFLRALAPHYAGDWWFPGEYAFDLAERGQPRRAGGLALLALGRNPRHAGAAHSLAHALFEAGDAGAGVAFLRAWLPGYCPSGAEHSHLSWHLALFELARGREGAADDVYRAGVDPAALPARRLPDSASFLWRRLLERPGRPLPWGPVGATAARSVSRPGSAFRDVHLAMALAGAGDGAAMTGLLRRLRAQATAGDSVTGEVSLPLALGLDAFGRGAFAEAARRLEGAAPAVPRLGGSNAQRALFGATLAEARRRAGRGPGRPN